MLTLENARDRVLGSLPASVPEEIPVSSAIKRILYSAVGSPINLPPFDNSAMDGFAVRSSVLTKAAADAIVTLRVAAEIPAGTSYTRTLADDECARVFTGSMLPPGADAVVMQEDTLPSGPGVMGFREPAQPWDNVRFCGEDIKAGTVIGNAGELVSVGMATLMAAVGIPTITIGRRPLVAIFATGDELVEASVPLRPGQIYESNRGLLAHLTAVSGAVPRVFPLVPDDLAKIRAAFKGAAEQCDAIISSGGVSVGKFDLVKPAVTELGGELDLWRVAIRPGKPFAYGRVGGRPFFGLPGNPVSALVTFLMLVSPALRQMQGAQDCELPTLPAVLVDPISNPGDRRHFVRVQMDQEGKAHVTGRQTSSMLSSIARANGLIDLPPESHWPAGKTVTVIRWDLG